jgi:signal transduction histidine kinase/CheY-like chemotaxis protein
VTELKKAEAALQRVNEELEQRVHDRTAQLESSNVELKREIADRQRAEGALQAERAQLARRVAERTADLSAANAELARSSRLKSEFLANMSHELRTPLNAILGLSESLLEQRSGPLTERQIRSVITIESSGRHLLSLINDVLDVSKVEAGKLVLELEDVDTRAICEASFQLVRQQAMSKRQTLQFTCEMDARPLYADPRRIKQMLVNLLSNAVKFTPEGGRIGLEVMGDAAAGRITFTVWDTGIGIAPEDQPRLFQPFVQVQSALSREYEGTGLGLVLVQRLAELHGGSVKLESDSNRGSRFIVSLPWNHAHISSGPRRTVEAEPITGVRSALIIEDAYTAYEQLERYLTEMDVRSVIHECGTGAVDRAAKVSPDVILLDILLPDLSGWEVLRQLKSNDQTRHIPVIVISVVDERGTPQADGAAGYLVKPISREQLKAALGAPPGDFSSVVPAGPTILLAEDNEANIHTIGDYLLDHGFQLIVARNGAEAIEHLRTEIPALVLMDIQMPVMDGLEAIRHIRSDAALSGVPIIALTALAMAGDRERCLTAGADDYLSKPVTLRELEQRIRQLLELPA